MSTVAYLVVRGIGLIALVTKVINSNPNRKSNPNFHANLSFTLNITLTVALT
jgi:hypothetical protein